MLDFKGLSSLSRGYLSYGKTIEGSPEIHGIFRETEENLDLGQVEQADRFSNFKLHCNVCSLFAPAFLRQKLAHSSQGFFHECEFISRLLPQVGILY